MGLYEFTGEHGLKASPFTVVVMALTWLPYQLVLAYAAVRALRRQLAGVDNWEKTAHVGAHRTGAHGTGAHSTAAPAAKVGSRA